MSDKEKIEAVKKHLRTPFMLEMENGEFEEFSFTDKFIDMYEDKQLLQFYEEMKANGVLD
jgi:hypothetical protein